MRFFIDKKSRIIVHGINNEIGKSITKEYLKKNLNLVGGVEPGKGGSWGVDGRIPVFDSMQTAGKALSPDTVIITVRTFYAYQAIIESINSEVKTIICFTQGIPLKDLVKIRSLLNSRQNTNFIGPNTFGIIRPGNFILGANHWLEIRKGRIGIIAYCDQMATEAAHILVENGFGLSTALGLGRCGNVGVRLLDLLQRFDQDPETDSIILLENAAGTYDQETYAFISEIISKPVVSYLPGINNPDEKLNPSSGSNDRRFFEQYLLKMNAIKNAGIPMLNNLLEISDYLKNL